MMVGEARNFLRSQFDIEPEKKEVGIGDWLLFAKISESVRYASSMPVIPLENGEPVSDHISLDPVEITIEGRVSDIFLREDPFVSFQRRVNARVGRITRYLPVRDQAQVQRVNEAVNTANDTINRIDELIDSGDSAKEFLGNLDEDSKSIQERFLDYMEKLHYGKQLIPIQTKFRTHKRMRITEFVVDRDNQNDALDFSITASQFRFAETETTDISDFFEDPSQDLKGQADESSDKGSQSGEEVTETSLLTDIFSAFGG